MIPTIYRAGCDRLRVLNTEFAEDYLKHTVLAKAVCPPSLTTQTSSCPLFFVVIRQNAAPLLSKAFHATGRVAAEVTAEPQESGASVSESPSVHPATHLKNHTRNRKLTWNVN